MVPVHDYDAPCHTVASPVADAPVLQVSKQLCRLQRLNVRQSASHLVARGGRGRSVSS